VLRAKPRRSASASRAKTERLDIGVHQVDNAREIGHYFADLARSKIPALWLASPFQNFGARCGTAPKVRTFERTDLTPRSR
jgi:hypothetical protein